MLCLLLPLGLLAEVDMADYMKTYVGSWSGTFSVHSTATGYTEAFKVEQQYWIDDGRLYGVSVMNQGEQLQTTNSITVIEKDHFYSVVKRGDTEEEYVGIIKDGGILWLPRNMNRAKDYQIHERMEKIEGKRHLKTEGFDTYVYSEGKAHLVYKGDLTEVVAESEGAPKP